MILFLIISLLLHSYQENKKRNNGVGNVKVVRQKKDMLQKDNANAN